MWLRTGILTSLALGAWISLSLGLYRTTFAGTEDGLWAGWSQALVQSFSGREASSARAENADRGKAAGPSATEGLQDPLYAPATIQGGPTAPKKTDQPEPCSPAAPWHTLGCAGEVDDAPEAGTSWRVMFPGAFPRGNSLPGDKAGAEDFLQCLTLWLNTHPHLLVCISGYADEMQDQDLNKRLVEARISYLKAQLLSRGVAESRLFQGVVQTAEPAGPRADSAPLTLFLFVAHDV
jgi:hypothetical protein